MQTPNTDHGLLDALGLVSVNDLARMLGPDDVSGFVDLQGLVSFYFGVLVYRSFILQAPDFIFFQDTGPLDMPDLLFFQDTGPVDMTDLDSFVFRYDPVARVGLPLGGSRSRQSPRPLADRGVLARLGSRRRAARALWTKAWLRHGRRAARAL